MSRGLFHSSHTLAVVVPKRLTCTGGWRGHSLSGAGGRWDGWKGAHGGPQREHAWRKGRQEALGDCREKTGLGETGPKHRQGPSYWALCPLLP